MTIDRSLPPTNKLLLECGPEGTKANLEWGAANIEVPLYDDRQDGKWWLCVWPREVLINTGGRGRFVYLHAAHHGDDFYGCQLPLGHVRTIGEVIDLYETLSQKKWPGT